MKKKLIIYTVLSTLLSFGNLINHTGIVSAQSLKQDTCKCECGTIPYTQEDDALCLECWDNQAKLVDIINKQSEQLSQKDTTIAGLNVKTDVLSRESEHFKDKSTDITKKYNKVLNKLKNARPIYTGLGAVFGFFLGINLK